MEQSNRRLKAVIGAGLVAAGGICLMGANEPPRTLRATSFILVDDAGHQRAVLSSNSNSVALQLQNVNGSRGVTLAAANDANGLVIYDSGGGARVSLTATMAGEDLGLMRPLSSQEMFLITDNSRGTAITIRDPAGHEMGPGVAISDANETPRAIVGPEGFLSFDKGGLVQWASFGEKLTPEELKQVIDLVNQTPQ